RHDDLLAQLPEWAVGLARDQPARPVPGTGGLECHRRVALVRDDDEDVRLAPRPQHELERLHGVAARLRRVERGAAAGEEEARVREAPVGRHLLEPFGLRRDPRARLLTGHGGVYTMAASWRASTSCTASTSASGTWTRWATATTRSS